MEGKDAFGVPALKAYFLTVNKIRGNGNDGPISKQQKQQTYLCPLEKQVYENV